MMKKFFLLQFFLGLCQIAAFAQMDYELVIDKTDGSEIVIPVEDIEQMFFRERNTSQPDLLDGPFPVGQWQECKPDGTLRDDATEYEVMHMNIYSNGTGDWWTVTKGKTDEYRYSFNYTCTMNGSSGSVTMTITASSRQSDVGQSLTMPVTYEKEILHGGENYYKKVGGGTGGESNVYYECPDGNHPHLIDLGLPSGTKWACCNVGATTPEQDGGYYAWGETEEKDEYYSSTYKWVENGKLSKYCTDSKRGIVDNKTLLDLADDVAHVKWGGVWVMPTLDQCEELAKNCSFVWTTQNGVIGCKFTGSNGCSIFLPASGWRDRYSLGNKGFSGYYWSSTLNESSPRGARYLFFDSSFVSAFQGYYRYNGLTVRPVSSSNN